MYNQGFFVTEDSTRFSSIQSILSSSSTLIGAQDCKYKIQVQMCSLQVVLCFGTRIFELGVMPVRSPELKQIHVRPIFGRAMSTN